MNEQKAFLAALLQHTSDVPARHLPLGGSLIAYKLLLNLYLSQRSGELPTVKALFATIPFSDMGIRYHLRKLLDAGWMELKPSATDKRTKVCVPTEKFNKAWTVVFDDLEQQISDSWYLKDTLTCNQCGEGSTDTLSHSGITR